MKNLLTLLLLSFALLVTSCKKTEHRVRFVNNYSLQVNAIRAGSTDLGSVAAGQSSDYAAIPTGDFSITGQTSTGYLQGNGSISGKGKHNWTITLGSDKILMLTEDN